MIFNYKASWFCNICQYHLYSVYDFERVILKEYIDSEFYLLIYFVFVFKKKSVFIAIYHGFSTCQINMENVLKMQCCCHLFVVLQLCQIGILYPYLMLHVAVKLFRQRDSSVAKSFELKGGANSSPTRKICSEDAQFWLVLKSTRKSTFGQFYGIFQ